MNNTSKIMIGVAAGAAVGAALGILFAPEKGSDLRRRIAEGSQKIANDVKEKFQAKANELRAKMNDLA